MKIIIPVYDKVDMLDVCGPYEMFRWAGIDVRLVAEAPGAVAFNQGMTSNVQSFTFNVASGLGEADPCDALWVPGGSPDSLGRIISDPKRTYLDFLVRQAAASRYVCSVCEGATLLAAARLLDGFTVTTHWAFIPWLIENYSSDENGATKVTVADGHPRFVLDRNRLTGGGISSGLDEALKLIELLAGTEAAQGVQQNTQYYPEPPVASMIPNTITSPMPVVS
jgi:cyclohexyl-isocyanide hydratase